MDIFEDYINKVVQEEVKKAIVNMKQSQIIEPDKVKPVYTNAEMMQLLGVDPKTLKKYRDSGLLGFTHPGDKYFYTYQDLVNFLMNKNYRYEPFNIK